MLLLPASASGAYVDVGAQRAEDVEELPVELGVDLASKVEVVRVGAHEAGHSLDPGQERRHGRAQLQRRAPIRRERSMRRAPKVVRQPKGVEQLPTGLREKRAPRPVAARPVATPACLAGRG